MGYDPRNEINNRYYAIGFNANITVINGVAYNNALSLGLSDGPYGQGCPNSGYSTQHSQSFAGRGIGSKKANTNDSIRWSNTGVQAMPGTSADALNMTFKIQAAGFINQNYIEDDNHSILSVDHNKVIQIIRPGF